MSLSTLLPGLAAAYIQHDLGNKQIDLGNQQLEYQKYSDALARQDAILAAKATEAKTMAGLDNMYKGLLMARPEDENKDGVVDAVAGDNMYNTVQNTMASSDISKQMTPGLTGAYADSLYGLTV
jgi:hypothetical protein